MDKLTNMEFASGKDFVQKQKELEDLLGVKEISPFGTYELEVFENDMKGATQLDLRKLAEKVGLNPFLDRGRLKNALINEFKNYTKMKLFTKVIKSSPHCLSCLVLGEDELKANSVK